MTFKAYLDIECASGFGDVLQPCVNTDNNRLVFKMTPATLAINSGASTITAIVSKEDEAKLLNILLERKEKQK